ncbi:ribosomal large subunit pseudouridine synthase D [Paludibacter propionicigenes WB4]|uniref:Pseudouridine synthase n=1 Tax=Paludibacter propionicigenes (strain DSM 17365 / JCM 13257 / WB4) TaxID=694427 RepID=E4T666_PALPW|nr:RluA family pseudouridine synthase [Paludibacter propionicigenes]ADQ80210.1 ribosomal large subunit pseudouridine synthase D [Paludibacter propionicigenes WB4]
MADDFFEEIEEDEVDGVGGEQELFEHFRFVVDKGQAMVRIDKHLVNCMSNTSRNRIQEAADAGNILVNGKPVKSNYRIKPYDIISIVLSYPPSQFEIIPQDIPINIVYEDDDIILVNKQPNLVVHPGFGNFDGTLLNAIAWHLKDHPEFDANDSRIGLVHRIDKDTSGLILIAKTEEAKAHLGKQFFNKTTQRRYHALVWGNVKEDEGTIVGALARDPRDRMLFTVFPEGENPLAKHAVTHYKVLERFAYVTLVECRLETGRTHQIRVHMKHIGHTLFNDERYGGHIILKGTNTAMYKAFVKNCFYICPRQALHAKTLGFVHPRTGEFMHFESELPDDMQELIDKWRKYAKLLAEE